MANAIFTHSIQVRWRDGDALGHVNHAVMLTFLEEGRDAFLVNRLGSLPMYVIVRIELEFLGELRIDRRTAASHIDKVTLGTTSFTLHERLTADAADIARAQTTCVRWNPDARRPVPLAPSERSALV